MAKQQTDARKKKTSSVSSGPVATAATDRAFVSKTKRRGSPQPAGKPHRVTYDCTDARYRRLKLASLNTGDSMNAIISSAIDDWLAVHPEALEI